MLLQRVKDRDGQVVFEDATKSREMVQMYRWNTKAILESELPYIEMPLSELQVISDELYHRVDWIDRCITLEVAPPYDTNTLAEFTGSRVVFYTALALTVGMLLHELTHVKHSGHTEEFYEALEELREVYAQIAEEGWG